MKLLLLVIMENWSWRSILGFIVVLHLSTAQTAGEITKSKDICDKRRNIFSQFHSEVSQCIIKLSNPFTVCQDCAKKYIQTIVSYRNLTTEVDGKNCRNLVIDNDRLNLVIVMHDQVTQMWEKAFCKDCFEWDESGNLDLNLSRNALDFLSFSEDFNTCHVNNVFEACIECSAVYTKLNHFYLTLEESHHKKICFDLQDQMNRSRSLWSKVFKCTSDKNNSMFNFVITSTFFTLLVVGFYGATTYSTLVAEDREFVGLTDNSNDDNEVLTRDAPSVNSGPSSSRPVYRKPPKQENADESSDEEMVGSRPVTVDERRDKLVLIDFGLDGDGSAAGPSSQASTPNQNIPKNSKALA